MKLILVIPAVGLLFSGALTDYSKSKWTLDPAFHKMPEKAMIAQASMETNTSGIKAAFTANDDAHLLDTKPNMWTRHHTISRGEGFDLNFRTPHPGYLGVLNPQGQFFYLVFPKSDGPVLLQPLVDSDAFAQMSALHINTANLSGDPYTYGVYENQKVFTQSGIYRFVLGENLHVDQEDELCILKIRYHHKRKTSTILTKNQSIVNVLP
jgi:hypothetical protein